MDRFAEIVHNYDWWKVVDSEYDMVQNHVIEAVKRETETNSRLNFNTLEIGCGTGNTTRLLLKADSRVRVAAIDTSPGMTACACALTPITFMELLLGRVLFGTLDICDIGPRLPNYFHLAVSVMTFHNIEPERRAEAIAATYRVLCPGGLFIAGDQLPPDDKGEADRLYQVWIDALNKAKLEDAEHADAFDFWLRHTIEDSERRLTERAQVALLEKAGFIEIQLRERLGIYRIVTARKPG